MDRKKGENEKKGGSQAGRQTREDIEKRAETNKRGGSDKRADREEGKKTMGVRHVTGMVRIT